MKTIFHNSIVDIGRDNWNSLASKHYPFTRYEFLAALENTGNESNAACCADTGWQPCHLAIYGDDDNPIALMPMYIKSHSYGEYVFDWAWADAYHRNGIEYYPKLVSAIPFTPSTGPRLLTQQIPASANTISPHSESVNIDYVASTLKSFCTDNQMESAHVLFAQQGLIDSLCGQELVTRESVQFHWFNQSEKQKPYSSFEEFLDGLKARKRKVIRKERRQSETQGLTIRRLRGHEIDQTLWETFYLFYRNTYLKRSGHTGYLPQSFFTEVGKSMADQVMMVIAFRDSQPVAAALNFYSSDTLYGRYWGCTEELECLHYELCYYQGIEFCIEQGLHTFDAGAQGEHKVQRGFMPIKTLSSHWIANTAFRKAISDFIDQEARYNQEYIKALSKQLPFKST